MTLSERALGRSIAAAIIGYCAGLPVWWLLPLVLGRHVTGPFLSWQWSALCGLVVLAAGWFLFLLPLAYGFYGAREQRKTVFVVFGAATGIGLTALATRPLAEVSGIDLERGLVSMRELYLCSSAVSGGIASAILMARGVSSRPASQNQASAERQTRDDMGDEVA